jgi:TonB family protein
VRAKVPADDVMLRLDVDASGRVHGAAILHASGQAVIDDAVRDAALRCEFQPARRQGRAVAAVTAILYPWAEGAAGLAFVKTSTEPAFRTAGEEARYLLKNSVHRGCPDA